MTCCRTWPVSPTTCSPAGSTVSQPIRGRRRRSNATVTSPWPTSSHAGTTRHRGSPRRCSRCTRTDRRSISSRTNTTCATRWDDPATVTTTSSPPPRMRRSPTGTGRLRWSWSSTTAPSSDRRRASRRSCCAASRPSRSCDRSPAGAPAAQVEAYDWAGEPDRIAAVVAEWFAFGPAEHPIIE